MDVSYRNIRTFIMHVIDWNDVISQDFSEARNELQKSITLEEINETIMAFRDCDKVEVVDGVGDILVTAGFYLYLQSGRDISFMDKLMAIDSELLKETGYLDWRLDKLKDDLEDYDTVDFKMLQFICAEAIRIFGEEYVQNYFCAILYSNESKFTPIHEYNHEVEMEHVESKYKDKFANIVPVTRMFRGKEVVLLRADNGHGKLLKPTGFKEPSAFL
jgi:hypothetical protein